MERDNGERLVNKGRGTVQARIVLVFYCVEGVDKSLNVISKIVKRILNVHSYHKEIIYV